jgi:phosphoglucosamine mutase
MGGIMISASHNPFADNGIKIFGPDGYKISDDVEEAIEKELVAGGKADLPTGREIGFVSHDDSSASFWLSNLARVAGENDGSRRLKIALDCANGALSKWAPKFFADLGYSVDAIGVNPDGININDGCGSTCISAILNVMKKEHFDIGFSFDGDADRVIAISSDGDIIDGDFILAITAKYLKDREKLPGNALVTTVMANLGLDLAMRNNDIKVFKTRVGDRYVLEEMQKNQAVVGGEQSGHIILADHATTGDGLLTACNLLRIMRETGATLKELSGVMSKLPQVLVNIRVKTKDYEHVPEIVEAIRDTEKRLSGRGRVLVRPSGTENLVRVMAEGPDEGEIKGLVEGIARTISNHLC